MHHLSLYWFEQDPSHVYYLVSTRLFSFTFGALLSYIHEGKLLLPERESGSVVPNALSLLCLGAFRLDVYNVQWNASRSVLHDDVYFIVCDDASSLLYDSRGCGGSLPLQLQRIYVLWKEKFLILLMVLSDSSDCANVFT